MSFTIQLPTPGTHAASPISAYWSVPASGLRKGSIICAASLVPPDLEGVCGGREGPCMAASHEHDVMTIYCVGETRSEERRGKQL